MRLRSGVSGLAVVALVAGCGQSTTPRGQVAAYLNRVNALESQLQAPLTVVSQNGSALALPQTGGAVAVARKRQRTLLGAWQQIRAVQARLAALPAPPVAVHLRALLLQLTARQADLTLQTARLEGFVPQFAQALKPLGPATARLERVLLINQANGTSAVAQVYAQKAQALRAFRSTAQSITTRLRGLSPPRVLLPDYRTELRAIAGMASSAGQLATALESGQPGNVAPQLKAFAQAAAAPGGQGVRGAETVAIKAYDRQATGVSQLAADAQRERLRLANTLT
jgi:hypothetical protein